MIRTNYRVTGYGPQGERLFSVVVEAVSPTDAELMAFVQLRKRPDGAALTQRASRIETESVGP